MGGLSLRVVVPVFGYTRSLPQLHQRLSAALEVHAGDLGFVYVLDGGAGDSSWEEVREVVEADRRGTALRLASNAGQQACIAVGVEQCRGLWTAVMDGDLQDPPELLPRLLHRAAQEQLEVVMTARRRTGQTFFRNFLGVLYHSLLLGRWNPPRYACFSLLSPAAVELFLQEPRRFGFYVRPLLQLPLRRGLEYYNRVASDATTYPGLKLVKLALNKLWGWHIAYRPATVSIAERI